MASALGSQFKERLAFLDFKEKALAKPRVTTIRQPYFCSGCPHNTSTRVPEGSRATAGIGCHFMAVWMDRNTSTFTHMGAEGAPWIGQAPFTEEKHIFANLGDGTYFHSGLLAIRAAVAAKVTMTYKILYNDAVAMTGGQHHDGPLDPAMISRQIAAEGVKPIVIVTDEPDKYPAGTNWAPGVTIRHRDELDAVQRELREQPGVSALIYDQTCASEKRRRRKRNAYPRSRQARRDQRNGVRGLRRLQQQVELPVGRAAGDRVRPQAHHQPVHLQQGLLLREGLLPELRHRRGRAAEEGQVAARRRSTIFPRCRMPRLPALQAPFGILVTGIGGTGVITIGQILGMAAHLEGKGVSVLDMSGLAQKYGAVMSHVKIAASAADVHVARLGTGDARLVIGCDLVVTASGDALDKMHAQKTRALVNGTTSPTAAFVKNPDWQLPGSDLQQDIREAGGRDAEFIPAAELATALMGDSIATNMFMLGYAWQKGWVPLGARVDRARHRAERRRGRLQPAVLRLGPARGGGPGARAPRGDTRGGDPDRAAFLAQPGRTGRAARAVPDRLPGCRVCGEVSRRSF